MSSGLFLDENRMNILAKKQGKAVESLGLEKQV